ncbi:hypothetical protein CsSME_00045405 [Camellia sinensis var. sinensis]
MTALTHGTQRLSLSKESRQINASNEAKIDGAGRLESGRMSDDIKAIAADASVFTFGDDEEFESDFMLGSKTLKVTQTVDQFYARLNDIVYSSFSLGDTIPEAELYVKSLDLFLNVIDQK